MTKLHRLHLYERAEGRTYADDVLQQRFITWLTCGSAPALKSLKLSKHFGGVNIRLVDCAFSHLAWCAGLAQLWLSNLEYRREAIVLDSRRGACQ